MKKNTTEVHLPNYLDKSQIPLVSQATMLQVSNFLQLARLSIGYSVDNLDRTGAFTESSQLPIFNASLIDYTHSAYIDYLSNLYSSRIDRSHLREAQEIFAIYQELVTNKHAYVFLRILAAGQATILKELFTYLSGLSIKHNAIQDMYQLKYTDKLPQAHFAHISEPHTLIASFIFAENK